MIMIMTKNVNTVMSKTLRPLNLTGGNKILFFYFLLRFPFYSKVIVKTFTLVQEMFK